MEPETSFRMPTYEEMVAELETAINAPLGVIGQELTDEVWNQITLDVAKLIEAYEGCRVMSVDIDGPRKVANVTVAVPSRLLPFELTVDPGEVIVRHCDGSAK